MYLYFNKQGVLTTVIPHGEPVRQGSYLNISVCLDYDFFLNKDYSDYSCDIELVFPKGEMGTPMAGLLDAEPEPFEKLDDSEITYDLVEGRRYWVYRFKFAPEQATFNAGKIEANVSLLRTSLEQGSEIQNTTSDNIIYYGTAQIYVEKTFGYAKRIVDMSAEHFSNLVNMLNQVNTSKVSLEGDIILILNSSDFIRRDPYNFSTYQLDTNNVVLNNMYQIVKLDDIYYRPVATTLMEQEKVAIKFLAQKSEKIFSLLSYDIRTKQWTLYDDQEFVNSIEFAQKVDEIMDYIQEKDKELKDKYTYLISEERAFAEWVESKLENQISNVESSLNTKILETKTELDGKIENKLRLVELTSHSGVIREEDIGLIMDEPHVVLFYENNYYFKEFSNNAVAKFTCVTQEKPSKNYVVMYREIKITRATRSYESSSRSIPYLDINGQIDKDLLPSFTDDVIVGYYHIGRFYKDEQTKELIEPEEGKLYIDLVQNVMYFWKDKYIELKTTADLSLEYKMQKIGDGIYQCTYYVADENYVDDGTLNLSDVAFNVNEEENKIETENPYEVYDDDLYLP